MVGADGVPGETSTKKLPSRKIRGRIFIVASLWIGRPLSLISIVTTAASLPGLPSILVTLPTLTPAMRTGEFLRIEFDDWKTALTRKPCVNGMCLVKPKKTPMHATTSTTSADHEGARARAVLARHALLVGCAASEHQRCRFVFSVVADWVPGTLPMTCLPTRKGSLPASHSFGWPGEAVLGYGLVCR